MLFGGQLAEFDFRQPALRRLLYEGFILDLGPAEFFHDMAVPFVSLSCCATAEVIVRAAANAITK